MATGILIGLYIGCILGGLSIGLIAAAYNAACKRGGK